LKDRKKWLEAFPLPEASRAVKVVLDGWNDLAAMHSKKLDAGLFGQWGAEQTEGILDVNTLEITNRHRTDIHYAWHNKNTRNEIIFEFKKLSHQKGSRTLYYNDKGMGRFIGGDYAKRQPLALMVGILMSPKEDCVPPLKQVFPFPNPAKKTIRKRFKYI